MSKPSTPPMRSLAKVNEKIVMGKAEVEVAAGEKTKMLSLNELDQEKNGAGLAGKKPIGDGKLYRQANSIDTLYSLFLNHLLRPREWSA